MKFTPETLIQIYLDGSFTEEAQAEFDALMRKDPVFAEKVTQAVAERLGPVPEATVNAVSSNLDGKIDGIWNRHKPSPFARILKWGLCVAAALVVGVGLYGGGRFLMARFPPVTAPSGSINAKGMISEENPVAAGHPERNEKTDTGVSVHGKTNSAGQAPASGVGGKDASRPVPLSLVTSGAKPGSSNSSALSQPISAQSLGSGSPDAVGSGTTAEGNSLRVAIDMDQTQKVTVTVYDAGGSLVRRLFSGLLAVGEHNVDWDGKDDSGKAVSPGDYTVILDMGSRKMSGTLKVLPNP